jgi:phospholipid/cholesterol/gamma-HCH transport system ATP-binding protein
VSRSKAIEFVGVHKSFGGQHVLRGIDLCVFQGEVLYIIGTSGAGKSVTIKHVIGLIGIDQGEIRFEGRPLQGLSERAFYDVRKQCGMVFQHSTLFDSLTVLDNVALPLRKHKKLSEGAAQAAARDRLTLVGMAPYADHYPAELGDGLRKRVAIARTLTLEPKAILFDEPTTGLDPVSARRVDQLILQLKRAGVTSVVVSHDLKSIFSTADRIAFIYQGGVYRVGSPNEFLASDDPIVQQFVRGQSQGPMETPGF